MMSLNVGIPSSEHNMMMMQQELELMFRISNKALLLPHTHATTP